ncbi:probable acyl-activating enzyme 6 [Arachis stenosperma]|uniref:probable acyl-activating enzyme 6 n=1 Tax=Arachis stenosperma TaxID=217475 RepID=UPI0025AC3BDF|nr:probable acyl-activating enzyme 6 [Arachis stenosperma]
MDQLKPNSANSSPLTPLTFLDRAGITYGDSTSVIYGRKSYTWTQTNRRCHQLASSLSSIGIGRGHVVSVLSSNNLATYELHFAVPMSGATLNNLNLRLDHRTLSLLLRHSESKLLFVHTLSQSLIHKALSLFPPNTPLPKLVLITDDTVGSHQMKTPLTNHVTVTETETEVETVTTLDFIDTYEGLIAKGDPTFKWARPNSEWDPITLNYTSGTTSSPKGVMHCHRGTFIMALDTLVDWCVPKNAVYLWTLPMFHSNGWSFPWGIAAVGGTNVCSRKIDAPTIYRLIELHGVTHMCAAPVVLNMLTSFGRTEPLRKPVHVLTGGSPPPAGILKRAERMGFVVSHGYGMTETCGVVLSCAWKREWDLFSAAERARMKVRQGVRTAAATAEVDVVDLKWGVSVKRDGLTQGEIVVRGACVMLGYFKDQEATSKCIKNGWLHTGDVAVVHEDGYIEIKDRLKDVIISGGENLSSVEVEAMLYTHPAVSDVAVVARPDEFWGETPCAFVKLKGRLERRPSEEEMVEFCRERLPHFMVPKTVVFRDELPRTSTGKVQKYVLRMVARAMGSLPLPSPSPPPPPIITPSSRM